MVLPLHRLVFHLYDFDRNFVVPQPYVSSIRKSGLVILFKTLQHLDIANSFEINIRVSVPPRQWLMDNSVVFKDFAARRLSQIPGHSVKKQSSSASKTSEIESPLIRKPLSPVSSRLSSKANIANYFDDHNRQRDSTMQRKPPSSEKQSATLSPSKLGIVSDGENRTPRTMPSPMPSTPSTMSTMVLAIKTPPTPRGSSGACPGDKSDEAVECSFEEVRSGFIQPRAYRYGVNFAN